MSPGARRRFGSDAIGSVGGLNSPVMILATVSGYDLTVSL